MLFPPDYSHGDVFTDTYLMGTVMLIFGMGLYELFVSTLEVGGDGCEEVRSPVCGSNLFGLFRMRVIFLGTFYVARVLHEQSTSSM